MEKFTALYQELDSSIADDGKVLSLINYFETSSSKDALWAISMLMGNFSKRAVSASVLKEWMLEVSDLPIWLFDEALSVSGDLCETVSILFSDPSVDTSFCLEEALGAITSIRKVNEIEKKEIVLTMWNSLDNDSRYVFNKLLTGGLRFNTTLKTLVLAISKYLGESENVISHRLMAEWSPEKVTFEELLLTPNNNESLSEPYPFHLASTLDIKKEGLGLPLEWAVEYKWDGIRGQLIKRKGEVFLWSRKEELVTFRFPEFKTLLDIQMDDFVLDGEIIGWKDDKPLSFFELQKRFSRKTVSKKLLEDIPVSYIAYDLLEYKEDDIRSKPYSFRRKLLGNLLSSQPTNSTFFLSDEVSFKEWQELDSICNNARPLGAEGLMLKNRGGPYLEGRVKGHWWKMKSEPLVIDAVLLYAMRANNNGGAHFTVFTFAVKQSDAFMPFAKASEGLSIEELVDINSFVKKNTIESFGPVKSVTPELVFELSFEGISKSSRHKSGIVLRSPRITRWRKDKLVKDINSLSDLTSMLDLYG